MSLDVYLNSDIPAKDGTGIFIRKDGRTVEITRAEWDEAMPGCDPVVADVNETACVYNGNITHNLNKMAAEADIYKPLWRPEEVGIRVGADLIAPLEDGLARLKADPAKFREFNPPNGWGSYEGLCQFVEEYLAACKGNPTCAVSVWR